MNTAWWRKMVLASDLATERIRFLESHNCDLQRANTEYLLRFRRAEAKLQALEVIIDRYDDVFRELRYAKAAS